MDQRKLHALTGAGSAAGELPAVDADYSAKNPPVPEHSEHFSLAALPVAGSSEIGRAIDLLNDTALAIADIHQAARRKQALPLAALEQAIDALIEDFADKPNTLFWALTSGRRMYHLCRRAVGCAVWSLAFAPYLRFEHEALRDLMLGAALLDLGKLHVPVVIMAKAGGLDKVEENFARRHVTESIRILNDTEVMSSTVLETIRSHHERIDGSGYPFGLRGDEIPLYAQMAAIVDSFDAMSLSRYYAEGINGHAALNVLLQECGTKFSAELVDEFLKVIGRFPTGTWVELEDGCQGVVCQQDETDPAAAQVALIADAEQEPFLAVRWLSLQRTGKTRLLPPGERPAHSAAMERSLQAAIYAGRVLKN